MTTDTPPSRSTSRSRRSYPNLQNLTLPIQPLSSKYTLPHDSSTPSSPQTHTPQPRTSYIQLKSAPTTPGILSRSTSPNASRSRRRRNNGSASGYAYDGYFMNPDVPLRGDGDVPKAKSTNALLSSSKHPHFHNSKKVLSSGPLSPSLNRSHNHNTTTTSDEWLHRAGLLISSETRESKGQSWLSRRESSTSLVQQHPQDSGFTLLSGEHYSTPSSPKISRLPSRAPSRTHSALNSRRGSRADLLLSAGYRTGEIEEEYASLDGIMEPDFVEHDDASDGNDEEEVARLARQRGFGLGGWVDRLIDWTLFSVDEDGEESSGEEDGRSRVSYSSNSNSGVMTKEEFQLRREVEAKRRKMEREAIVEGQAAAARTETRERKEGEKVEGLEPPPQEGGTWQDAAWLLSVASKVLL